ncbi:hypothetical protein PFISCL1PPCAC_12558, partial [Pristionchus fissidentatus]
VDCINLPGRFYFSGTSIFVVASGNRCTDVDECKKIHPCSKFPPVRCINTHGSYHCDHCPHGFAGNGKLCRRVRPCYSNPCNANADCLVN